MDTWHGERRHYNQASLWVGGSCPKENSETKILGKETTVLLELNPVLIVQYVLTTAKRNLWQWHCICFLFNQHPKGQTNRHSRHYWRLSICVFLGGKMWEALSRPPGLRWEVPSRTQTTNQTVRRQDKCQPITEKLYPYGHFLLLKQGWADESKEKMPQGSEYESKCVYWHMKKPVSSLHKANIADDFNDKRHNFILNRVSVLLSSLTDRRGDKQVSVISISVVLK